MVSAHEPGSVFRFWAGLPAVRQQSCEEALRMPEIGLIQRGVRVVANAVTERMSSAERLCIMDCAKRIRNPARSISLRSLLDLPPNRLVLGLRDRASSWESRWPDRKTMAVCVTHDVDSKSGMDFLDRLAALETEAGICSTYNFLGGKASYECDAVLLGDLKAAGFEVGVHGYTHDISLGDRGVGHMVSRIGMARRRIRPTHGGFRSPALSTSERLLSVLGLLGFRYDSSSQVASPLHPSVGFSFPFLHRRAGLWELPLTIQDDLFLRDSRTSREEAMVAIRRVADDTSRLGGLLVMNFHPHLIRQNIGFYQELLAYVRSLDGWLTTCGGVCDWVDQFREQLAGGCKRCAV
jgi:hypothetical protein